MSRLTPSEVLAMLLALGTLLGIARLLGELAKRFGQPAVLGEILAGILLGPTVFGAAMPELAGFLFPKQGALAVVLDGMSTLAVVLFLLVAGMEVDLSIIWRQGRPAIAVSLSGIIFPFALGLGAAFLAPELLGQEPGADRFAFALFFAAALSISALPVIAKTLMDLKLYRTDLGMVVIAAAIFNDLVGWIIFAVVLGMMHGPGNLAGAEIGVTIWLTLGYAVGMLTVGRWLIDRMLPFIQAHTSWPGGVLSFAVTLALFCAAFTEWLGVHAIFGAFIFGVALGDSSHLREQTRATLDRFVSFIFAPLFFASIGLKVNFVTHFDLVLVVVVLLIACLGKIFGGYVGGSIGGLPRRQALAVGFGMNARGAMEIILGLLALQAGVIREPMFVALVIMALVTSFLSGPMMQRLLAQRKARKFTDYLTNKTFARPLLTADRWEAIRQLSALASKVSGLDEATITSAVIARESNVGTGLPNRIAIPHARLPGIALPVIAVGICEGGVDFDAPDGELAVIIVLVVTPLDDANVQLELLADIARTFHDLPAVARAISAANYTEFLAWANTREHAEPRS